jgi:hypothetical protein
MFFFAFNPHDKSEEPEGDQPRISWSITDGWPLPVPPSDRLASGFQNSDLTTRKSPYYLERDEC